MSLPVKRTRYMSRRRSSAPDPDEPAAIQEPQYSDVITCIANMLDPKSLVNFSMTCKSMHAACQKASVEFFVDRKLNVSSEPEFTATWLPPNRSKVSKGPLVVRLKKLSFEDKVDDAFLQSTRSYLDHRRVKSINCVSVEASCSNPQGLFEFVRDYHVRDFVTEICFPATVLKSLLELDFDSFGCSNRVKSNIAELPFPVLRLFNTKVNPKTFKDILRKFANDTSVIHWHFGVTSWVSSVASVREIIKETKFRPASPAQAEPRVQQTYCYGVKAPVLFWDREGHRVECEWKYGVVRISRQRKYKYNKKSD